MSRQIINAYIDEDGNVCYEIENNQSIYNCEYVIKPKYFNLTPITPHICVLDVYHIKFPEVLIASRNIEQDCCYDKFMQDVAQNVAFLIENYC